MQQNNEEPIQWFEEALFGMFIHWGPYAVAGRGEWAMNHESIPHEEYVERYAKPFHAENFNPEAWVDLAVEAGMKYIVFTTRHHDGFSMWDTETSEFNSVRMGPQRDIVKLVADAVRKRGLKLGFYYSIADWRHPDYPGAYYRDWPSEWKDDDSERRFADYNRAQLKELMTLYGKVDLLWYDGNLPLNRFGEDINRMVKQLQPHILINNRHGIPFDFQCSEQTIKSASRGVPWEACMTLNANWGYHAEDKEYKTAEQVISMLMETSSQGGNLLLNVGPKPDGVIPEQSCNILRKVGSWLRQNGSSLYSRSPYNLSLSIVTSPMPLTMIKPVYTLETTVDPAQVKAGGSLNLTASFDLLEGDISYVVMHVANFDFWERFSRISETEYEMSYDILNEAPSGSYNLEICGVSASGLSGTITVISIDILDE